MSIPVTITNSNFPEGYCWSGPQQFANDLTALLTGTTGDIDGVIISDTLPAPEDQGKLWVRTVSGIIEGLYIYQGNWMRPYRIPYNSNEIMIWKGTSTELKTYDGGVDEAVSDTTGPFWEPDTDFAFRFPIGNGTNGTTYDGNPATVIAEQATGGAEKVQLVEDELGFTEHKHCIGRMSKDSGSGADDGFFLTGSATVASGNARGVSGDWDANHTADISSLSGEKLVSANAELDAGATAAKYHDNMPPFKSVIFAKRTARKYIIQTA